MPELLCSLAISAFALSVAWYRTGHGISPDGEYYLRAARGQPVPAPYNRRLLPRIVGHRTVTWRIVSLVSLLLTGPLVWLYTHSLAAVWLFSFLPMFHLNARLPVLMDPPSMAFALGAALCWQRGWHIPAGALAIAAGGCHERGGTFAAVFAWSPLLLLLGLLLPVVFRNAWRGEPDKVWLSSPFTTARATRDILDARRMLLPWGVFPALLVWLDLRVAVALVVGYAQNLIAQDDSRLYQWAAPAVLTLTPLAPHWLIATMCALQPWTLWVHRTGT
jgi:hypothetical protein